MTSGSLDGSTRRPFDGWWLNFRNFDYVSTYLKHFSKREAAISELRTALKICMLGLSVRNIVPFETKYLGITLKEPDY